MTLRKEIITSVISRCRVSTIRETILRWGRINTLHLNDNVFRGSKREIAERLVRLAQPKAAFNDEIMGDLELAYMQLHSQSKMWTVYKLAGSDLHLNLDPRSLRAKVIHHLQLKWKDGQVDGNMSLFAGAVWLRMHLSTAASRRKTGRDSKLYNHNNSVFVVTFPGSPYVILSRAGIKHTRAITQAVTDAMNAENLKDIQLSGRHVSSLADIALKKDNEMLSSKYRDKEEKENPLLVRRTRKRKAPEESFPDSEDIVVENRREKQLRLAEVEKKFGPDFQPVLEKLEYKFSLKFHGLPEASDLDCNTIVEIRGTSVLEGLRELAEKGVVKTPLPKHLTTVTSNCRNKFTVESKKK